MQRRWRVALVGLGLALIVGACKKPASEGQPEPAAPAALPEAGPRCELAGLPLRLPAAERVVAVGDVHGDLAATRRVLRLAGAIDADDRWIGGKLVLVQVGDVLDRGDDEPEIIALFARLVDEARAAGGAFVPLLGNHELMNAAGDLRYVTPGGFEDYGGQAGRVAAFRPAGPQAKVFAGYRTVVIVGDTVFAHGGVESQHAGDLEALNRGVRCWLDGAGDAPAGIRAPDGPVWSRAFSVSPEKCDDLERVLGALGVSRMVVGHTPQNRINAACENQVWRVDTGLAAHYGGKTQALEIRGDQVSVLE